MATQRTTYERYGRPLFLGLVCTLVIAVVGWLAIQELAAPKPIILPTGVNEQLPPHTPPDTPQQAASYSVPPTHPRRLIIPAIGVAANIVSVGLTKNNAIDTPKTAWQVGWYTGSPTPGSPGALLIDGHVNDAFGTPGIFAKLHTLSRNDAIQIERGDGQIFAYKVVTKDQLPAQAVNMKQVLAPINGSSSGLNLITCGGNYDHSNGTFSDRIIIFAAPQTNA